VETCAVLTTKANEVVRPIHERMPVILAPEDYATWLDPAVQRPEQVQLLLRPFPADQLVAYPGSKRVNDPKNNDP
jgi:putative SOS response-associated peptidase YedK